ncbi:MAG: DUF3794 domain-containing protein [Clostridia bacterium]|nr:DUF3794 domain-containing protein [Clostridia bacterium]
MLIKGDKREQIYPTQFYLDQELSVVGAERVICVMVSAKVSSWEAYQGEARINYRALYRAIYKDTEGSINCYEQSFDNNAVVKSPVITPKSYLDMDICVLSSEFVGKTDIKIRAAMEIRGYCIVDFGFNAIEPEDGICKKTLPITVENIQPVRESEIVASSSIDVKEQIDKVLSYDTKIVLKKVAAATEICEIEGECYVHLIYTSGGNLLSRCISIPFETEILAPNVTADCEVYCSAQANSTTITLENTSGGSEIKMEIVVGIKGFCVGKQEIMLVTDAYSCTKEIKLTAETVYLEDSVCLTGVYEKISGSVRLEEGSKRLRSVLCVCPPSVGALTASNTGSLAVEGIISANVIYIDEDEQLSVLLAEIPYHFVVSRDFTCQDNLYAKAMVTGFMAKARHNDQVEISGDIYIEVYGSGIRPTKVITALEELGDREQNDCAISLYIVKPGETLWDVAKALMCEEETLAKLNPDLKLPLMGGEKVLLYREL